MTELDHMLMDLNKPSSDMADYNSDYGLSSVALSEFEKPPARPPPPKMSKLDNKKTAFQGNDKTNSLKLPKANRPPKLQHVLANGGRHDLVKATPRDEDVMKAPDFEDDYDYGESDYSKVAESIIPSDEELEKVDAGETPRGDKSMVIKTDYGNLKSKYRYKGFGLWENTEPADPPPPPKKPSPPPPPPKAEPIWYNCTVSVEVHASSKELDDLEHGLDGYDRMPKRNVELGKAGGDCPTCIGDIYEPFPKEDFYEEMFRRAFLEKMALCETVQPTKYKCCVCGEWIEGRVITALSRKYHPRCFCCTYCRKEFKQRTFKTDQDGKPYCYVCFEKLLGHFGNAQFVPKVAVTM